MKEFDEINAIKHIRNCAGNRFSAQYSNDDILLVIDTIFDYFEANDDDDNFELDLNALVEYVKKQLRKDKGNVIVDDDVQAIVEAELSYEDSLFED